MTNDAKPDYTTMSGAEFKRAVGVDPEKWGEAFEQRMGRAVADSEFTLSASREARVAYMVGWFRDAMEAAVKAAVAPRWDQQYSDEELKAAVKDTRDTDERRI